MITFFCEHCLAYGYTSKCSMCGRMLKIIIKDEETTDE